jgi:hypothetical protein
MVQFSNVLSSNVIGSDKHTYTWGLRISLVFPVVGSMQGCYKEGRLFHTLRCKWNNVICIACKCTVIIFAALNKWNFMACGKGNLHINVEVTISIWMSSPNCVKCKGCMKGKVVVMASGSGYFSQNVRLWRDLCNDQVLWTACMMVAHMLQAASSPWPRCYGFVEYVAVLHRVGRLFFEWHSSVCGLPDKRTLMQDVSSCWESHCVVILWSVTEMGSHTGGIGKLNFLHSCNAAWRNVTSFWWREPNGTSWCHTDWHRPGGEEQLNVDILECKIVMTGSWPGVKKKQMDI